MMDVADDLARLNYINGLRLEALDFRTEQKFHMDVRRRLTAALFSPGIATGLEVEKADSAHFIRIEPGVAIDHRGREIILLDAVEMPVIGVPNPVEGVTLGNFVAIEYGEERQSPRDLSACWPDDATPPLRGAPSRIVHTPRIVFLDAWPAEDSGRIVLAQVSLGTDCAVQEISADVRRYVAAARPPTVTPISLAGEKDIDANTPKILRFHVEGDRPQSATLYLRAAEFSSLYYTELGRHDHEVDIRSSTRNQTFNHTHDAAGATTGEAGSHTHNYRVDEGESSGGIDVNQTQVAGRVNTDPSAIIEAGEHTHDLGDFEISEAEISRSHSHEVQGNTEVRGLAGGDAREGNRLLHIDDLRVSFDGVDRTNQVLAELNAAHGGGGWASLGDGTNGHPLVQDGTGAIDLIRLGLDLTVGEHLFEFAVEGDGNGGQIQFNLYLS